jgi:hypothetical protein
MSDSREDQLADDLLRRLRSYAKQLGGSTQKEVTFEIAGPDEAVAARQLEKRGLAEVEGNQVTVNVNTLPAWLRD